MTNYIKSFWRIICITTIYLVKICPVIIALFFMYKTNIDCNILNSLVTGLFASIVVVSIDVSIKYDILQFRMQGKIIEWHKDASFDTLGANTDDICEQLCELNNKIHDIVDILYEHRRIFSGFSKIENDLINLMLAIEKETTINKNALGNGYSGIIQYSVMKRYMTDDHINRIDGLIKACTNTYFPIIFRDTIILWKCHIKRKEYKDINNYIQSIINVCIGEDKSRTAELNIRQCIKNNREFFERQQKSQIASPNESISDEHIKLLKDYSDKLTNIYKENEEKCIRMIISNISIIG